VKKAEKALADAEEEHRLREQAVAERLQTMSDPLLLRVQILPSPFFDYCLFSCTLLKLSFPTFPVPSVIQVSPEYRC
jgi:hypothetical protein